MSNQGRGRATSNRGGHRGGSRGRGADSFGHGEHRERRDDFQGDRFRDGQQRGGRGGGRGNRGGSRGRGFERGASRGGGGQGRFYENSYDNWPGPGMEPDMPLPSRRRVESPENLNSGDPQSAENAEEIAAEIPEIPEEEDDKDVNDQLAKELIKVEIARKKICFPQKPNPGTEGSAFSLLTNYFILKWDFNEPVTYHRYDVSIEQQDNETAQNVDPTVVAGPRRRSRKLNRRLQRIIIDEMIESQRGLNGVFGGASPIHDGAKTLFTKKKLVAKEKDEERFRFEITVKEKPTSRPVNYIVELLNHIELLIDPKLYVYSAEIIQFVDIALRFGPTKKKIPVGPKLFSPSPHDRHKLSMHKELAFGFYQSARNCERGFMLNVDHATCVFHSPGPLMDVFVECRGKNILKNPVPIKRDIREMNNELRGMRVALTHLPYEKVVSIKRFSDKSALEMTFPRSQKNEDGEIVSTEQISVSKYFQEKYWKLKFPNLPIVDVGTKKKLEWYPLEVCKLLPDQYIVQNYKPEIIREMTEIVSKQKPNVRFNYIKTSVNRIREESSIYLSEYGLKLFPHYVKLTGRRLDAPIMKCGQSVSFEPDQDCAWRYHRTAGSSEKHFYEPVCVKWWGLVDVSGRSISDDFLRDFAKKIISVGSNYGVTMNQPLFCVRHAFQNRDVLEKSVFERAQFMAKSKGMKANERFQLFVFIVSGGQEDYGAIKYIGDNILGIPTQCVSAEKFNQDVKRNMLLKDSYVGNVMQKINSRLNGINLLLEENWLAKKNIHLNNCMFVGVDVTHPAPNDKYKLSIASCVGTYDSSFVHYYVKLRVQEKARRELVDLQISIDALLQSYKKHNQRFPENIIIFRDGVSEGQFEQVFTFEILQLKNLFQTYEINPKLTYIVVVKRHNTRFLTERRDNATYSLNVPAGLVVDTVITHPTMFDFFLCSHNALLGTLHPTHYFVLLNENNYDADFVQKLTFYMCFLNPRSTKSGSIPAPIVLADSSAFRARKHIVEAIGADSSVSSLSEEGDEENEEERNECIRKLNEIVTAADGINEFLYYI